MSRSRSESDDGVVRGGSSANPELDRYAPTSSQRQRALIGSLLGGRYQVEALLGSGGMGAVYRAQHVHMKKAVALKVLHREMMYLPEVVARFEREAVAAGRIEHPHVAAASDFGRLDDGAFYLVLEYVEGRSLAQLIKDEGSLPPRRALTITRQVAEALSAAHAAGVVHRDLKPENVMLVDREGDDDFVKVLDFGIAKLSVEGNEQLTQLGTVFGTPEYMAPEQAAGTGVDLRADLYTLGILLYEMLGGRTPFHDDDMIVVLTRQMAEDPPPLPAHVPPALAGFVMQLLRKEPDRRPQSALELIAQIDQLLGDSLTPGPVVVGAPLSSVTSAAESAVARSVIGTHTDPGLAAAATVLDAPRVAPPSTLQAAVETPGRRFPMWAVFAAGGAALVLGFATVLFVGLLVRDPAAPGGALAAVAGGGHNELVEKASSGDANALREIAALPDDDKGSAEWRALGRGNALLRNFSQALIAYDHALSLNPALAQDPLLRQDVQSSLAQSGSEVAAMKLAAKHFGAWGADLIFDGMEKRRKNNRDLAAAARELLESPPLRKQASPALLVALDLGAAKKCSEYQAVLPRAAQHADARSLSRLKRLNQRRGCGFLGLRDCYSCLRRGSELRDAIESAEAKPAPQL